MDVAVPTTTFAQETEIAESAATYDAVCIQGVFAIVIVILILCFAHRIFQNLLARSEATDVLHANLQLCKMQQEHLEFKIAMAMEMGVPRSDVMSLVSSAPCGTKVLPIGGDALAFENSQSVALLPEDLQQERQFLGMVRLPDGSCCDRIQGSSNTYVPKLYSGEDCIAGECLRDTESTGIDSNLSPLSLRTHDFSNLPLITVTKSDNTAYIAQRRDSPVRRFVQGRQSTSRRFTWAS